MPRWTKTLAERLADKYELAGANECWNWIGVRDRDGYGRIQYNGSLHLAHRIMLISLGREIKAGLEVDHLCRNRACVNPAHLEIVTAAENRRRKYEAQTHCRAGHEYNQANTRFRETSSGGVKRNCRVCERANSKRYQLRRKAQADGEVA